MVQQAQQTAIVLGSGMAGLAVAKVLARHFDRVVVVEKDEPQEAGLSALDAAKMQAKARPGVWQGLQLYDDIFDGRFSTALKRAGGKVVNQFESYILCHPATGLQPWLHTADIKQPIPVAIATRHLFESTARGLLSEDPRVEFKYGKVVTGLLFAGPEAEAPVEKEHEEENAGRRRNGAATAVHGGSAGDGGDGAGNGKQQQQQQVVRGVRLSDGSVLTGQLVVDASGRGSNMPGWLAAGGFQRPHTSRAGCNAGYAGWLCKLAPKVEEVLDAHNIHSVVCFPNPPVRTLALLLRVEDGLCFVGLGGNEGEYPSRDEQDIREFAAKKVWHPSIHNLLSGSTFMGPVHHCSNLTSTWRHYEKVTLPDGLLVLGDAVCALNPSYGQGMTVAAIEASELDRLLCSRTVKQQQQQRQRQQERLGTEFAGQNSDAGDSSHSRCRSSSSSSSGSNWLSGLNAEFQRAILPTVLAAWGLAAGSDMRYPTACSNEPINNSVVEKVAFAFVMELFKLSGSDAAVCASLSRVMNLLEPPSSLIRPSIITKVLLLKALQLMPAGLRAHAAAWLPSGVAAAAGVATVEKKTSSSGSRAGPHARLLHLLGVPTR